jgi:hypothetical protein
MASQSEEVSRYKSYVHAFGWWARAHPTFLPSLSLSLIWADCRCRLVTNLNSSFKLARAQHTHTHTHTHSHACLHLIWAWQRHVTWHIKTIVWYAAACVSYIWYICNTLHTKYPDICLYTSFHRELEQRYCWIKDERSSAAASFAIPWHVE